MYDISVIYDGLIISRIRNFRREKELHYVTLQEVHYTVASYILSELRWERLNKYVNFIMFGPISTIVSYLVY